MSVDIKRLQQTNKELKEIVNNSWDGIAIIDKDSKLLYVNNAFSPIFGYKKTEFIGKRFDEFIIDDYKFIFQDLLKENEIDRYSSETEVVCKRKDNQKVYVLVTISLMNNKKFFTLNTKDITKQISDDEILDKYLISCQTDKDGVIVSASEAFCQLSGFSKDELIGSTHKIMKNNSTPKELIKKAVILADRVSCNLELPTNKSLAFWAPEKKKSELIKILSLITKNFLGNEKHPSVSTQLIIGASRDSDKTILKLADSLYKSKIVKRVYYSAYIPVNQDPELPEVKEPPVLREYRLYQADKLIREYRFSISELFSCGENLSLDKDPKLAWALSHPEFFPVDLARADYFELLRIPGIGPQTARKILAIRKNTPLNEYTLRKLGLPLEKISKFITIKGKKIRRLFENELFPQIKTENLSGLQCNNSLFAGSYRSI